MTFLYILHIKYYYVLCTFLKVYLFISERGRRPEQERLREREKILKQTPTEHEFLVWPLISQP